MVCVADLGKDGREDDGALRISEDGSVGLRLASLGGGAVDSERLERIKARAEGGGARRRSGGSSTWRCTRAQEHLVLSGATDLEKLPRARRRCASRCAGSGAACAGLPREAASGEHVRRARGARCACAARCCARHRRRGAARGRPRPGPPEPAPPGDGARRSPSSAWPRCRRRGALPVSRLSYSASRTTGAAATASTWSGPAAGPVERPAGGRAPTARGRACRACCAARSCTSCSSALDFRRPRVPSEAEVASADRAPRREPVRPEDVADLRGDGRAASPARELRERIARARPRARPSCRSRSRSRRPARAGAACW